MTTTLPGIIAQKRLDLTRRLRVLAVQDIASGQSWRVRADSVIAMSGLEVEAKGADPENGHEIRKLSAVMLHLVSGKDIAVLGRLEDWHARVFGDPKSRLEI